MYFRNIIFTHIHDGFYFTHIGNTHHFSTCHHIISYYTLT